MHSIIARLATLSLSDKVANLLQTQLLGRFSIAADEGAGIRVNPLNLRANCSRRLAICTENDNCAKEVGLSLKGTRAIGALLETHDFRAKRATIHA